MHQNEFTPEEGFKIIQKAISNIKTNYKESAQIFLLWGWILSLACLAQFVILKIFQYKEVYDQLGYIVSAIG